MKKWLHLPWQNTPCRASKRQFSNFACTGQVGRCLAWALTHGKIIFFHLGKIYLPHTTRQPSFQDLPKISSVPKAHSFLQASLSESRSFIRTDTSFSFQSKTYWHANLNSAETVPASLQCKDSFSSMRKFREVKVKELRGYLTCT